AGKNAAYRCKRLAIQRWVQWLEDDHVGVALAFQVLVAVEGNEAILIVWTLIHGILNLLLHHPNNIEHLPANFDRLAYCGGALKDFLVSVVAENHYPPV